MIFETSSLEEFCLNFHRLKERHMIDSIQPYVSTIAGEGDSDSAMQEYESCWICKSLDKCSIGSNRRHYPIEVGSLEDDPLHKPRSKGTCPYFKLSISPEAYEHYNETINKNFNEQNKMWTIF